MGSYQAEQTHCKHGHPFNEANTLPWRGRRLCRACGRERMRARYKPRVREPVESRFMRSVNQAADCWEWTARRDQKGYGIFYVDERSRRAHQVAYEFHVGPIPAGLELDHLCRNRACVNPAHLEAVTHAENMRRAVRSRTVCQNGHALTSSNRELYGRCRTCFLEHHRRAHASRRARLARERA